MPSPCDHLASLALDVLEREVRSAMRNPILNILNLNGYLIANPKMEAIALNGKLREKFKRKRANSAAL